MTRRSVETFKTKTSTGKLIEMECEAIGFYEDKYGADADGNRGEPRWFIDEYNYKIPVEDGHGNLLTLDEIDEISDDLVAQIKNHDWEF